MRNPDGALPRLVFAAMGATVAVGLALDATGVRLGTRHPPFLARWEPVFEPGTLVAAVVLALTVLAAGSLRRASVARFVAGSLLATLAVRLAVAAARGGPDAWDRVLDPARSFAANYDYLAGLPALADGRRLFLDRFAELVPALPVHASGHPPGLLLSLDALGIRSPAAFAALCIGVGVLATPLAFFATRPLLGDARARIAALLMIVSPAAVLFGATSADAIYLTLGLVAAWPLAIAATARRVPPGITATGALALALGSLFAWSLLAVAAWAGLLALVRRGKARALCIVAACGAAVLSVWALLAATTGFDAIGTLRATGDAYAVGVASVRPYAFWVFGSPAAFLVFLGIPVAWCALHALGAREPVAVAVFAVIVIASLAGFTKAETERIWLFLVPFVAVAAAAGLPERRLYTVLWALAVQALTTEILVDTVW